MKHRFITNVVRIALWVVTAIGSACDQESASDLPYYYLELQPRRCQLKATLNGFPVVDQQFDVTGFNTAQLNMHLQPTNNHVVIQVEPIFRSDPVKLGDLLNDVLIKRYQRPQSTGSNAGTLVDRFTIPVDAADWPVTLETRFDLAGDDATHLTVGQRYAQCLPIGDQVRLREYGLHLIKLFADKDLDSLLREFEPKLQDAAQAGKKEVSHIRDQFEEYLRDQCFAGTPRTGVTIDQIVLVPWAEDRLWHVSLGPDEPLLASITDEGWRLMIDVFVAQVDGQLRVVR